MRLSMGTTIGASNIRGIPGGGGESVHFTDFTEYTIGSKPSDWIAVLFEHSNATYQWEVDSSYNLVRGEFSTDEQDGIYWDIAPVGVADLGVDILSLVEALNTTSKARTAVMARFAAGYSQSTNGMLSDSATNGYLFEIVQGTTARISKYVNGVFTDLGSTAFSYSAVSSLYYMRFQLIGDQLKAKIWLSTDVEPAAWLLEVTDATFNSGFYGISTQRRSAIHDFRLEVL